MTHLPSDKHSIAWFKLAEFVSRGEKEKALGIYKLLMLSIDDMAFAHKLEGDILFSFKDKVALDKYYKAAVLYQQEEKYIQAAAIYENLITLCPEAIEYLNKLLYLYNKLNLSMQITFTLNRIFTLQLKKNEINEALKTLEEIETKTNDCLNLYEIIVFDLIDKQFNNQLVTKYLNKTLDGYLIDNDRTKLQQFLSKLETLNAKHYKEALKHIKE